MSLIMNPLATTGQPIGELTASQADEVRSELLARRADHSVRLGEAHNQTTTLDDDGAVDDGLVYERFSIERSRDAMIEVDAALARLADGTYGSCETCRSQIAVERLEAIPDARRCITCAALEWGSSRRSGRA